MSNNIWQNDHWARTRAQHKDRQRRRRRRFRSYILQILLGTILVTALFLALSLTVFFNISEIQITGTKQYTAQDFMVDTDVTLGNNLFRINTEQLEKQVLEQNVEFDSVSVTRSFPDGLTVKITPAETACACYYQNQYYYVSESGRLLKINESYAEDSGIPLVGGVDLSAYRTGDFVADSDAYIPVLRLFRTLKKYGFDGITAVNFSPIGEITFCYQNQITVQVGTTVELEYKLQIVKKVIDEYVEGQEGIIDARTVSMAYFRPMTMAVQEEKGKAVTVVEEKPSSTPDRSSEEDGSVTPTGADGVTEDGTQTWEDSTGEDGTQDATAESW